MTFSIIVPIYNVERYLKQCVESVLAQTYTDFELILVDDGSPDACPAICDRMAENDNRIRVIHKPNGGLSDARNAGLDNAKGDYIIFLDSDDWWVDAGSLEKINDRIKATDCDILIFGIEKFNDHTGQFFDVRVPSSPLNDIPASDSVISGIYVACSCDKVVKRNIIEDSATRFRKGQLSEDIEWCIRLIHANPRISVLPVLIYAYRQNPLSISHNVKRKNIEDILAVIKLYSKEYAADKAVMNFIAVQYVLLLATSARVPSCEIKDLLSEMKQLAYLLDHSDNRRVRTARLFRPLGVNSMRRLMGLYQKWRG